MKPTKYTSSYYIPTNPDDRPGQRLNEVVGLPDKPDDLNILIERKDPIPYKDQPKGRPRKLTFVCSVEWVWGPNYKMNEITNYYINPKSWGWALWNNWLDDGDDPCSTEKWSWWWNFMAYSGRTKADERTIATHMLIASWKDEAEHQYLDHYHWINNTGCLDVEDIQAIAREVWG